MEGAADDVRGLNLGCAFDESRQGLQHSRVRIRVVSIGIVLVFPETDYGHISAASTSESDFVLKTILFTK